MRLHHTIIGCGVLALLLIGSRCEGWCGETAKDPDVQAILQRHPPDAPPTPLERVFAGKKVRSATSETVEDILAKHPEDQEPDEEQIRKLLEGDSDSAVPTGLVNFTILNDTGPCAARIRIFDAEHRPVGALAGLDWLWADGACRLRLPVGLYNITVQQGLRTNPWRSTVTVRPDHVVRRRVTLQPFAPVQTGGWRPFDFRIHAIRPRGRTDAYRFASLDDVSQAARGEGLQVVGVDGAWSHLNSRGLPYSELAEGGDLLSKSFGQQQRADFQLLYTAFVQTAGGGSYYAIEPIPPPAPEQSATGEAFDAARRRGALIIAANPLENSEATDVSSLANPSFPVDVVAGPVAQGLELSGREDDFRLWYMLLNQGYRMSAATGGASTDERSASPSLDVPAVGGYVYLGERDPTPRGVVQALRDGKTIAGNGPFIQVHVDQRRPGSILRPSATSRVVNVEALSTALPKDCIQRLELVYNGEVIMAWNGDRQQKSFRSQFRYRFTEVGWLVARYISTDSRSWAVSNPVYFVAPGYAPLVPVLTEVTLSIRNLAGPLPRDAVVEIWNHGTKLETRRIDRPKVRFSAPSTAELCIRAQGCQNQRQRVYPHTAAPAYLAQFENASQRRDAFLRWETYKEVRNRLQTASIDVVLSPK